MGVGIVRFFVSQNWHRIHIGRAAAIALVLGAAACGGNSPASVASQEATTAIADCRGTTEAAPGAPTPAAGVSFVKMTVDGQLRDYRLFQPPSLDLSKPVPLAIMFHGSPIDAAGFEDLIHFDKEASAGGFIVASPNGCGGFWSYAEGGSNAKDGNFVKAMIQQLETKLPIDKSRVFLVGASAGTWVEYRMACDAAGLITAIASVAGTMRLSDECNPSRPVSILEMHGTLDDEHPWQGGGPHKAFPVDAVIQKWTQLDGCSGAPLNSQSGITVTSVWKTCKDGAVVRLDKVVGGQHTWFGSDLAPTPGEPDASSVIWSFVSSLPSSG